MHNASVAAVDEVLNRFLDRFQVVDRHDIGLNPTDILEQNKGVVDHFEFEQMLYFRRPRNDGSDNGPFDILCRKKMREFFLGLMVVVRTRDENRIPFADRVFLRPGRNRGVERLIQIFNDDPDAFVLGTVL